ncbi:MAG: hypothetical protein COB51_04305 [Moraxellaceae bacterium]|nr:MAG: hypothetical protein COB51_04305 [Moraxellaceae bacterium]
MINFKMPQQRPKGIFRFLVIYLLIVILNAISYYRSESLSDIYLIVFASLINLKFSYGVFFGDPGPIGFIIKFCVLISVLGLIYLGVQFEFSFDILRATIWVVYCSALAGYLHAIKHHEFFKYGRGS